MSLDQMVRSLLFFLYCRSLQGACIKNHVPSCLVTFLDCPDVFSGLHAEESK